jgi:hypothetical protein
LDWRHAATRATASREGHGNNEVSDEEDREDGGGIAQAQPARDRHDKRSEAALHGVSPFSVFFVCK